MAPMLLNHDSIDGAMSDINYAYFLERAKGGVGLIFTCGCKVENTIEKCNLDGLYPNQNPKLFAERLKKLTDEMKKYDSKMFVQISSGFGRVVFPPLIENNSFVAPSETTNRWDPRVKHRALTTEEVETYVECFAKAAKVCKDGGAAGVEVHALHEGYLLDSFSMELFNQRTDKYGGSLENRLRFAKEIREAIAIECGADFPVSMRLGIKSYIKDIRQGGLPGEDFEEKGREIEEGLEIAKLLEQYGYDALNVDAGTYDSWYWPHPPLYHERGCYLKFSRLVKQVVDIPVICAGRMGYPDLALEALNNNDLDIVGLGRPLIADPYFCNKLLEGKEEQIRPCLSCHDGCIQQGDQKPSKCVVNARAGREIYEPEQLKTNKAKRVIVIGGGPVGMETARLLAEKGHKVSLYEATDRLGGLFYYASIPEFKSDGNRLITWWTNELKRLGVEINLNYKVDKDDEILKNSDVIVCAVGSFDLIPPIPGINGKNVLTAKQVLEGCKTGENVSIIGGGLVGCELAIWLSKMGKKVQIVEMAEKLMPKGCPLPNELMILDLLKFHKVKVNLRTKLTEIHDDKIVVEQNGEKSEISAESVIIALGYKSNNTLYDELVSEYENVYNVGDSNKVADVLHGVYDTYELCKQI